MLNPYSKIYGWWCAYVLLMDGTYTAFVVPIGVGFNTSSVQWDWVGIFDFIAGMYTCKDSLQASKKGPSSTQTVPVQCSSRAHL